MKGKGRSAAMVRAAAIAGMAGPVLFASVLVVLTVVQYDFMLGIGWRPLGDPAGAWPSGLALGPYGWVQISNFVVSGLLLMIFAVGLHHGVTGGRGSRVGPGLLLVAGIAMALMGFETDPIRRTTPRTLHGWIHDLAFVLFALALLCALSFLWWRLKKDPFWRNHARYTLTTGILATLLLVLPGVAYYLFIAVVLLWIGTTGVRLWRSTVGGEMEYHSGSASAPIEGTTGEVRARRESGEGGASGETQGTVVGGDGVGLTTLAGSYLPP